MSQTGGGQPPPGRARQFIRRALKLPYSDLSLTEKSDLPIELGDHFELGLVLPYGIGPNEPRLLAVDDLGRLALSQVAGNQAMATMTDDPTFSSARARVITDNDNVVPVPGLDVIARAALYNGATWDRAREAAAAAVAAKSGLGVQLVAPAGEFSVVSAPAAGAAAVAQQAAGAAGVRHIARRVSFGFSSQAVLGGVSTVTFNLRDGASGAGAILKSWTFDLPAAIIAPFLAAFELSDPGSAATAMTLETAAAVAGLRVFCNLSGYDAS